MPRDRTAFLLHSAFVDFASQLGMQAIGGAAERAAERGAADAAAAVAGGEEKSAGERRGEKKEGMGEGVGGGDAKPAVDGETVLREVFKDSGVCVEVHRDEVDPSRKVVSKIDVPWRSVPRRESERRAAVEASLLKGLAADENTAAQVRKGGGLGVVERVREREVSE